MSLDVERNMDLSFKLTNLFLTGALTMTEVVLEVGNYLNKDPSAKLLNKYVKNGGQLDFTVCQPKFEKELAERLKDAGVTFLQTSSMAKGGVNLFLYADYEREKVDRVLAEFRAEHSRDGIADRSVFYAYADGNVRQLSGLDNAQAMLVAEHAEKRGMKIIVDEPQKGVFNISYAGKDLEKMTRIKADVAIELAGEAGKALRKQLDYENRNVVRILNKINSHAEKEPAHVVDLNGQKLEIDRYGVRYEGQESVITVDRNEENFKERANELLQRMRGPVLLTDEKMKEFEKEPDKKAFLVKADRENGRPAYTADEYQAVREMMEKKELYELKLSMLNPDQAAYDICIENDDMRLATFEEFNDLNEVESFEKSEELKPEILDEVRESMREMNDRRINATQQDLELEEEVLDGLAIDRQYDDLARDILHDQNNNLIPDEYEQ